MKIATKDNLLDLIKTLTAVRVLLSFKSITAVREFDNKTPMTNPKNKT